MWKLLSALARLFRTEDAALVTVLALVAISVFISLRLILGHSGLVASAP